MAFHRKDSDDSTLVATGAKVDGIMRPCRKQVVALQERDPHTAEERLPRPIDAVRIDERPRVAPLNVNEVHIGDAGWSRRSLLNSCNPGDERRVDFGDIAEQGSDGEASTEKNGG